MRVSHKYILYSEKYTLAEHLKNMPLHPETYLPGKLVMLQFILYHKDAHGKIKYENRYFLQMTKRLL